MSRQPENFLETVKEVRRQRGLSQEELAHVLGVSLATVNRWENGKVPVHPPWQKGSDALYVSA